MKIKEKSKYRSQTTVMVTSKQLLVVEKITKKTGKERAKTIGETKAFEKIWKDS